jgi:hypothetical protein
VRKSTAKKMKQQREAYRAAQEAVAQSEAIEKSRNTAYHEAGHAVAAVVQGFCVEFVTIEKSVARPGASQALEEVIGNTRVQYTLNQLHDPSFMNRIAVKGLAGLAADRKRGIFRDRGSIETDVDTDTAGVYRLFHLHGVGKNEWVTRREALDTKADEFVTEHWKAIEKIAEKLIREKTITGAQLSEELYPFIADVQP